MARAERTPYSSRATKKARGVMKKFNPFKAKASRPKTPTLKAFKSVRPTPVKKSKKSGGITATSTPKVGKVKSRVLAEDYQRSEESKDYIPLETSPSPAIRRSGRKKTPTSRFGGHPAPVTRPPPSPASLLAREHNKAAPIVIDITITEDDDDAPPTTQGDEVVLLGDRKRGRKKAANKNATKEPGEILEILSDDESDHRASSSNNEITIVGEKKMKPFPSVLNRLTPAKAKQGYAEYLRDNHRQQRRNQPYPAMGTKASSRSRLKGSNQRGSWGQWATGSSAPNLRHLQQLPILQEGQQDTRPPKSPASSANPNNLIQGYQEPLFKTGKRPVVIDGSNVAVQHSIAIGRGARFSCQGIKICVDFFKSRGHEVTVFVPQYRTKSGQSDDRHLLDQLYKSGTLAFTPSASYDDRYVLQYAQTCGGIVVSNDQYNDIKNESPELFFVATRRKLGFTWVKNTLMFPQDPMGRDGPNLNEFLKY